jgi:hypothetical protein
MHKFFYLPKLGGCVYVPDYADNAWFLKTDDADPEIPGEGGGEQVAEGGAQAMPKALRRMIGLTRMR